MYIKIGTRKSKLALIQTQMVIDQITLHYPDAICEIVPIITTGDVVQDKPLYEIGGKALFLKEIEKALLEEQIDIAVHSLKDVPGTLPEGLKIAACLEREDPRDVFVSFNFKSIEDLPHGSTVGTCSPRRKVFLHKIRPDLIIVPLRGNIDSRLHKLREGQFDAAVLASAGLKRLGLFDESFCHILEPLKMLPAVGQGVVTVEIRSADLAMSAICDKINHLLTWQAISPERAFLEYMDASCKTPLAAYTSELIDDKMKVDFMIADFEGSYLLLHSETGMVNEGREVGIKAAKALSARILVEL